MALQTAAATAVVHLTGLQEQRLAHPLSSGETGKLCAPSPPGDRGCSHTALVNGCEDL